jgi:hypothetical protein
MMQGNATSTTSANAIDITLLGWFKYHFAYMTAGLGSSSDFYGLYRVTACNFCGQTDKV